MPKPDKNLLGKPKDTNQKGVALWATETGV